MRVSYLASVVLVAGESLSPMGKIIEMLDKMIVDSKAAYSEEGVLAAKTEGECNMQKADLNRQIQGEVDTIEESKSIILKSEAKIAECLEEIAVRDADTDANKQDMAAATEVRQLEKTDAIAASTDYKESINALSRAMQLLKSETANVSEQATLNAPSFTQLISESKKSVQSEFLKGQLLSNLEAAFMQAGQVPQSGDKVAYGSALSGVIKMLEDLKGKFRSESTKLAADEQKAQSEFDQLMGARNGANGNNKDVVNRKNLQKGEAEANKGGAEQTKAQAIASMGSLKTLLAKTTVECNADKRHYEKQLQERLDEIDAMNQAIVLLKEKVQPNDASVDPTARRVGVDTSFLQLSGGNSLSNSQEESSSKIVQEQLQRGEHAIQLLLQAANESSRTGGAKTYEALAARLQTVSNQMAQTGETGSTALMQVGKKNPFQQVINMIRSIIKDINESMVKDAATHGQCEADKATSKLEKEQLQKDLAEATAKQDQLSAQKEKLTVEIADLTESLLNLSRDKEAATVERNENKASNEKTMAECTIALDGLQDAIEILDASQKKTASAADAAEPANAETYGGASKGLSAVLQMLSVVQKDFVREQSEAETAEAEQADAYKELMNSSEITVARKSTNKKMKEETLAVTSRDLVAKTEEVENLTGQLDNAIKHEELVHKRCKGGVSFEERQEQIAKEIQNLDEAREVLSGFSATAAPGAEAEES